MGQDTIDHEEGIEAVILERSAVLRRPGQLLDGVPLHINGQVSKDKGTVSLQVSSYFFLSPYFSGPAACCLLPGSCSLLPCISRHMAILPMQHTCIFHRGGYLILAQVSSMLLQLDGMPGHAQHQGGSADAACSCITTILQPY